MGYTVCTFQAFSLVLTAGSPYWWLCWCFHKGWIQNLLAVCSPFLLSILFLSLFLRDTRNCGTIYNFSLCR
jgi:hypothetical protein